VLGSKKGKEKGPFFFFPLPWGCKPRRVCHEVSDRTQAQPRCSGDGSFSGLPRDDLSAQLTKNPAEYFFWNNDANASSPSPINDITLRVLTVV